MDLEAIPGLSDDVNTEIYSMNEEFSGHQNEEDADDCDSVNLDRSVQDREEEAIVREYFDGSPCCALGPKKGRLVGSVVVERNSYKLGRRAWI